MAWLTGLFNLRNVAIIAALCLTAFTVQSLRIKWLKSSKESLKAEVVKLEDKRDAWKAKYNLEHDKHMETVKANQSNQEAIAELEQENQQCALTRELNETHAAKELTRHQGRIADIQNKYDKLKKNLPTTGCGYTERIDRAVIDLMQASSGQRD